jgi:hypothetical protein
VGVTTLLPELETAPTSGVIVIEVAPVTCHSKMDVSPSGIAEGLAENWTMKGCPVFAITVGVTVAVTEPASLVAVNVYVLVLAGDTCSSPTAATVPTPWSMVTDVAPPTCHCKSANSPGCMLVGYIEKRSITGSGVG